MSSKPLERLVRSFTFRLSLGYAALFTLSAAVLFGLLYLLLASTLDRKDPEPAPTPTPPATPPANPPPRP